LLNLFSLRRRINVFVTVALADHSEREAPPEVPL
jgi:hypothetical protein